MAEYRLHCFPESGNCYKPALMLALGVMAFLKSRAQSALGVADKHLAKQDFIAGPKPTIVDISMTGYMFFPPEETGFDLQSDYSNIAAWLDRMTALKGWQGPYELMPGTRVPHRA